MSPASVALVGGGPGDPGLLTLRAEALLGLAGVVVADASLVETARLLAGDAQVLGVLDGRAAISVLLRMSARSTRPVVRLYRGDPWLHPAFEVEREALERAHRTIEVVAGVAVEIALPALAGVPVHHRRLAVACTIGPCEALPRAAQPARTLVGVGAHPEAMVRAMAGDGDGTIASALVPVDDPGATWRGPLADAAGPAATMPGPALLVVGSVCGLGPSPAGAGLLASSAPPATGPDAGSSLAANDPNPGPSGPAVTGPGAGSGPAPTDPGPRSSGPVAAGADPRAGEPLDQAGHPGDDDRRGRR